ncbi:MAG TPA: SDR family oxidoreductase [Planctomycetota bacterium]|nr:SDR family oxidoreductase [Planctomycetota bacterium]
MTHLVIGASGQVGKSLMRFLGDEAVGTAHTRASGRLIPLDLADIGAVGRLVREKMPKAIYVPGGVTAVDWCETHEAEARRICVDGTVAIREAAESIGAHVVFFSTDYVYSGKAGPYTETDPPDPISAYGRIKLEAEKAAGPGFTVLRTSMVYSDESDSKNFHNFVRDTLRAGREVKAFSDQSGSPAYAPMVAASAMVAMKGARTGIIHAGGPEVLTRIVFARRVARAYGLDEGRIKSVTSEELPMPAARPKRGGLISPNWAPLLRHLCVASSLDEALAEMTKTNSR